MKKRIAKAPAKALEADIQATIVEYARALGWLVVVTDAGAIRRASRGQIERAALPKGWPDLTMIGPGGRVIFIECKRLGETPKPEQKGMQILLRSHGAICEYFDNVDEAIRFMSKTNSLLSKHAITPKKG